MRYYSLDKYYKEKYGQKVGKLSLSVFNTCPNRDGSLSQRGCIFCSEKGSGDTNFYNLSIKNQIEKQKQVSRSKWKVSKFIAYLQSFTNTYEDIETLANVYSSILEDEDILGLSIATRADCLDEDVLDLLLKYKNITDLNLEIGMQTTNEDTISYINRGYSHKYLNRKLKELKALDIDFGLHIIVGLPGEELKDIDKTVEYINHIQPRSIKIHNLYIQDNAPIYKDFQDDRIWSISKDEYTDIVVRIISMLDPGIVIERLTGDADRSRLVYPTWSSDKLAVIGQINKKLKERQIIQGSNLK